MSVLYWFQGLSLVAALVCLASIACVGVEDELTGPVGVAGVAGYLALAAFAWSGPVREAGLGVLVVVTGLLVRRYLRRRLTCPFCQILWGFNVVLLALGVAAALR